MSEEKGNNQNNQAEKLTADKLEEKNEQLRRELEDEKQRHLRTRADFENYRKRVDRNIDTAKTTVKKEILTDLLKFLDYFEQARQQIRDQAAAEGLEIMARQLYEVLHRHGVRPIECLGQPFNPEEQEGVGYTQTDSCPEGCVAEELCTGYKLDDILLKPARVMVARRD